MVRNFVTHVCLSGWSTNQRLILAPTPTRPRIPLLLLRQNCWSPKRHYLYSIDYTHDCSEFCKHFSENFKASGTKTVWKLLATLLGEFQKFRIFKVWKTKHFFIFKGVIDPEEHDGAVKKSLCGHVVALESGKGQKWIIEFLKIKIFLEHHSTLVGT